MNFKAGDKVKCIDNEGIKDYFTLGETYVVDEVPYNEHIVIQHKGQSAWHSDRFELIEKEKEMGKYKTVNGVKLATGQQWTTLCYGVVTIEHAYDNQMYNWRCINEDYRFSVTSDGKYWTDDKCPTLLECVYNPAQPEQFTPQPWDKIICNNGEEFTCCTLEFIRKKVSSSINTNKPIVGYSEAVGWQNWGTDGVAVEGYSIKEIVPKQKEEAADTTVYTKEDIRNACITDLGWPEYSFGVLMESLEKVKNPKYMEYLRLKAVFEGEQQEL